MKFLVQRPLRKFVDRFVFTYEFFVPIHVEMICYYIIFRIHFNPFIYHFFIKFELLFFLFFRPYLWISFPFDRVKIRMLWDKSLILINSSLKFINNNIHVSSILPRRGFQFFHNSVSFWILAVLFTIKCIITDL